MVTKQEKTHRRCSENGFVPKRGPGKQTTTVEEAQSPNARDQTKIDEVYINFTNEQILELSI